MHNVETDDGYILEVHRIVASGKRPVLLMHGMLDSSATWIMLGPGKALGTASVTYSNMYFEILHVRININFGNYIIPIRLYTL